MYAAAAQELNAGHYREALRKLDAIDARQPDMAAAQNLRGVAWMRLGEYRKAETALRKAREIDPDFWEARFNLAEVPFLTQDWTEARRRFKALAAEPNDHLQGPTSDLIQFKILLTFLLEDKEKMGASILARLRSIPKAIWRARFGARSRPMACTRPSSARGETRTGPTGTRRTWWRSSRARNCRSEQ
jgi:tetratricopeptide (TPR) repeat protein